MQFLCGAGDMKYSMSFIAPLNSNMFNTLNRSQVRYPQIGGAETITNNA
jgi:hypothetical protein